MTQNRRTAPTIVDVARLAGVSKSTVSRLINGESGVSERAAHRVRAAMQELGYTPNSVARALKQRTTGIVGLIIPSIENPIFPRIVKAIETTAAAMGLVTILCNSDGGVAKEGQYVRLLAEKKVDGLILNAMGDYHPDFDLVRRRQIPLVLLGDKIAGLHSSNVTLNHRQGACDAVEYLIRQGRRRIAFVPGIHESFTALGGRYEGYCLALERNGLPLNPRLIATGDPQTPVADLMAPILSGEPFDALFASNDLTAIACMQALLGQGRRIPDDVAVMGYDNIPMSEWVSPSLSTVDNPKQWLGETAMRMLGDIIRTGDDDHRQVWAETPLVLRGSA